MPQHLGCLAVSFIFPHGLICSFSSPSSPIPSMIAHHASVYLVQLPGTDCGQVGPLAARPSASPNRFSSQAPPPFQWLNRDQEAVRYTEAQLAKERGECPGELSMCITSDYLQFYPEDFEGKASIGTLPAIAYVYSK